LERRGDLRVQHLYLGIRDIQIIFEILHTLLL
jgi:hypothetical protein